MGKNLPWSGWIITLCLCLGLMTLPVQAEEPPLRIAVVNLSVLLEKAPQSQAASNKLKAEYSAKEQQLEAEKNAIKQAQDTLTNQIEAGTLNATDQLQQERDLRSRERTYNRNMEDFRDELRTARDLAMDSVQNVIFQAIEEVRAQQGIDLVFKENDYIVASKRVDMTDKVLAYLVTQQSNTGQSPHPSNKQ